MTDEDPLRVYFDANVFITIVEKVSEATYKPIAEALASLLEATEKGRIRVFTSELTLAEVRVAPIRRGDMGLLAAYDRMLTNEGLLTLVPVAKPVLLTASQVRATRTSLRLPDAIHAASAIEVGCRVFVSDDRRLRPPPEASFEVLCFDLASLHELIARA
jgi:predicted nucleic acid-binding protein